jgi:hypothetical protein
LNIGNKVRIAITPRRHFEENLPLRFPRGFTRNSQAIVSNTLEERLLKSKDEDGKQATRSGRALRQRPLIMFSRWQPANSEQTEQPL